MSTKEENKRKIPYYFLKNFILNIHTTKRLIPNLKHITLQYFITGYSSMMEIFAKIIWYASFFSIFGK